jgi:hypothetical protein
MPSVPTYEGPRLGHFIEGDPQPRPSPAYACRSTYERNRLGGTFFTWQVRAATRIAGISENGYGTAFERKGRQRLAFEHDRPNDGRGGYWGV